MEGYKTFYAEEAELAKQKGVAMESFERLRPTLISKDEYQRREAASGLECQRIKYMSDNLKVVGHIFKPKSTSGKKYPVIIYNRGGNREFGKNTSGLLMRFNPFLTSGFVVIASQYRGNDGGEGKEEFGGADLNDVMNLLPLVKSLPYADTNNLFMYGASRGGMMTYLALKKGFPVNAAATVGGVSDLKANGARRPEMMRQFSELMPDFAKRQDELLRERSAIGWAEEINTPLLLLHGGSDWRVETPQALALANRLQESGKTYELIIYAKDDHGLSFNRADRDRRIIEWFKRYMK